MFQKFKKSLSLRLVKKNSRNESPCRDARERHSLASSSAMLENSHMDNMTLSRRRGSADSHALTDKEEESKSTFL